MGYRTIPPLLILNDFRPRSIIYSDAWTAYATLNDHGYTHLIINHSENFVDPINNQIYTQNTECL